MSFRFWIGTWTALILMILVAIDASALVCYITRFTEENFATLIAFIFIYKVRKVVQLSTVKPSRLKYCFDNAIYFLYSKKEILFHIKISFSKKYYTNVSSFDANMNCVYNIFYVMII